MRVLLNKNIIFFLLFIIYFKSAFAIEKPNQFKIEADKSIEYFEKQKTYVASGNAIASKGKFSIKAEKITVFMEKTKNSDMTDIEASGDVIIVDEDTLAKSAYAKYNFKRKHITLKGKYQFIESKKFKLSSKKFISFDDINKIALSEGDVNLFLGSSIHISSDRIKADFDKIDNTLITAFANGNVKIKTKSETITSTSAKYNNNTNLISLEGNVVINRDNSLLSGQKGYMNLKTRKSRIESEKSKRVKGIFKPTNK